MLRELIIISSEQSPGGLQLEVTRTTFQLLEFSHGKLNFRFTVLHTTPCKQVYIQFYLLRSRGGLRIVEDKKDFNFFKKQCCGSKFFLLPECSRLAVAVL